MAAAKTWTAAEVRKLPPAIDIPTAAGILGISRSLAYQLVQAGDFPVPVLHLGNRIRIPTAGLRRLLGLEVDDAQAS